MRRFVLTLIPVLTLILFVIFMNGGKYVKRPLGEHDNVSKYIDLLKEDITNEHWDKAEQDRLNMESAWNSVLPRVQFFLETNEVADFEISLARIKGSIIARDKAASLIEVSEIDMLWKQIAT